jgi:replication fork protection complex subunit Tof1/Swi1
MASTWPHHEGNGPSEEDGVPDVEDEGDAEEGEDMIHETMFTFEAFEMVRDRARTRRTVSVLTKIINWTR